jgi:NCAIR mutase (PurE)-related protein
MRPEEVKDLLRGVAEGATRTEDALRALERLPVENLGFATLDTHRELRQGMPEAIYAEGKKAEEVVEIAARLLEATTGPVLATRVPEETARALIERFPEARHHESARLVVLRPENADVDLGIVAIVSAGTSDLPVADEAACVAEAVGASVARMNDVGVAGLHRLLAVEDRLREANVVIVVAGMEGALASLVGGITPAPVIAVPTSVGYGASFEGLAALLAMLNSCAAGVVVTNIDNGFGAAAFALRLLRAMR